MIPEPQIIRALVPPEPLDTLRHLLEHVYGLMPSDERPEVQAAVKWGGISLAWMQPRIDHLIQPVIDAIQARFPGARLMPDVSAFRRIVPDTYIYWHMDADGTGSVRYDPLFNCWMPLEHVGHDYPSLEIITNSEPLMRRVGVKPPGHRDDEWVEKNIPYPDILCPDMAPGDALIFSHFLLHRTQPMAHLKGPRIGCEFRFTLKEI